MTADILIVDDEADIRELISGILEDEGYQTRLAHNSDATLAAIEDRKPSLVILDIWLQGSRLDGLDLLNVIKERLPDLPVIIISGHGNIETAVSAIKRGAYDYVEKPFKADRLILVVGRALEAFRLKRENDELRGRAGVDTEMVGNSVTMRQFRQALKKVSPANSRVLISGPPGAGKELTARIIHNWSQRLTGPFVILAAATMAPERLEEELFGMEDQQGGQVRVGALEEAHGGTLYIDEVSDMPIETQGKVLRVLVDQTFQRVNGTKRVKVDVRILSSTSRDLDNLIKLGLFREDLYHRLAVVPVRVPALAERRDDIPDLIEHFTKLYSAVSGQAQRRFAGDAVAVLQTQEWPGNVRQLRNNVERLMIMTAGDGAQEINAAMLANDSNGSSSAGLGGLGSEQLMALSLREAREIFERDYLAAQLARFGGNISKTASFVGMERSALHRKIKLLGLSDNNRGEDD